MLKYICRVSFTLISVWFYFVTRSRSENMFSCTYVLIEKPNVVTDGYLHTHVEECVNAMEHCLQLTYIEYIMLHNILESCS